MNASPALPALLAGAVLAAAAGPAGAQTAVAARVGTTGLGGEFAVALSDSFGLRAGAFGGSLTRDVTKSDIRYDGKLKFGSALTLLDYHPAGGGFRLSLGLAYNNNRFDGRASSTNGSYEINGTTYPAAEVGTLSGKLSFRKASPYVGIGWGNAAASAGSGLFFSADLGAMIGTDPRVQLTARCGTALTTAQCSQLQSDLRAEEDDIRDSVKNFYPVLSLGIGYRF